MKLPKFIKASTHQERQQKLMTSNRQLMLTDTIFKLQPTKQSCLFRDILNESCKVNSNSEEWPQTPSTPLYQIKTNTNKLNDSVVLSKNLGTQNSGRYVKSAQPKRLQRNFYNAKINQTEGDFSTPTTPRLATPKIDRFISISGSEFKAQKSLGSIMSPLSNTSSDLTMDVDNLANMENQYPQYSNCIYKSYEQYKQIEAKINQDITAARNKKKRCQPSAGVTGSLLKQIKKNPNFDNNILVASFLINNPIVFNTEENGSPICVEKIPFICESSGTKLSRTKIRSLF